MLLYHLTITSSRGTIHKVGITKNITKRLQQYNNYLAHENVEVQNLRELDSIEKARRLEREIYSQFIPIAGREYLILDGEGLKKFNSIFYSNHIEEKIDTEPIIDINELVKQQQELEIIYKNYSNKIYELNSLRKQLTSIIESRLIKHEDHVVINKDDYASRVGKMLRNDKARELMSRVSVGTVYTKTQFDSLVDEWVSIVRTMYPEMKFNHNTIKVLNEFCSRLGYMWKVERCRVDGLFSRTYKVVRL